MSRWNRSDVLSLVSLVIGVIGLLIVLLQILPAVLPEVAIVTHTAQSQLKGLATVTTRFRNISYDVPINDLQAEWIVDPSDVSIAVDSPAIRYSISNTGQKKIFRTTAPIPAQMEFQTIFNSPKPFVVSDFYVKAHQLIVSPTGHIIAEVPILEQDQYDRLLAQRYADAARVLVGFVVAYIFLVLVTKKLMGNSQVAAEEGK